MWSNSVGLKCPLQLSSAGLGTGLSSGFPSCSNIMVALPGGGTGGWKCLLGDLLLLVTLALGDVKLSWNREGMLELGWSLC